MRSGDRVRRDPGRVVIRGSSDDARAQKRPETAQRSPTPRLVGRFTHGFGSEALSPRQRKKDFSNFLTLRAAGNGCDSGRQVSGPRRYGSEPFGRCRTARLMAFAGGRSSVLEGRPLQRRATRRGWARVVGRFELSIEPCRGCSKAGATALRLHLLPPDPLDGTACAFLRLEPRAPLRGSPTQVETKEVEP